MLNPIAAVKFLADQVSVEPPPDTTPATITYFATPPEAAERGLELRDPPEHGWAQKRA